MAKKANKEVGKHKTLDFDEDNTTLDDSMLPDELNDKKEQKEVKTKSVKAKAPKPKAKAEKDMDSDIAVGDAKTLTPDILKDSMKLIEKLSKEVEELKQQNKKINSTLSEEGFDTDDPVEDYLDVPVVFFSFSSSYAIFSDKRYGRESLPPRSEPIKFKKLYRYQRNAGGKRGLEVVSVSQAVINSKATVEYLREHSLYGIKFFESIAKAQDVDVTLAEKMSEMNSVVSSMNDHQAIERCKREGIEILTSDVRELRRKLIHKMAMDAIKRDKERHSIRMKNASFDKDGRVIEEKTIDADAIKPADVY